MRIVAVDWSGKEKGAAESLWLAEVCGGTLTDLRNGLERERLTARLLELADEDPRMVVGLDFAFSFPAWWCAEEGWRSAEDLWAAMRHSGEELLSVCDAPLWGRPGKRNPHSKERLYRRTETEGYAAQPKSVFQIGGAGAVGTGSIRGMPHLLALAEHGFGVWPFSDGWPRAVEIYPRALTGKVKKNSWAERHAHLFRRFPGQPADLLERAAGSEDAFDAAVSALVMSEHGAELQSLAPTTDPVYGIEGRIWLPERGG